jgi:hypothetical protein
MQRRAGSVSSALATNVAVPAPRSSKPSLHACWCRGVHDFNRDLALSDSFADVPRWLEIYPEAFPTMISALSVRNDGRAQRGGIDRVITLA